MATTDDRGRGRSASTSLFARGLRRLRRSRRPGSMWQYFDGLADVYDDWWTSTGRLDPTRAERPGWDEETGAVIDILRGLAPARTLDVACGTGFLTQFLPGDVVGLDQSEKMLEVARRRVPEATFVRGDALALPFAESSFDRVVASHLYAHLSQADGAQFLGEVRRVASELVLLDTARKPEQPPEEEQTRSLANGSRYTVLKRRFTAEQLQSELGGGRVLHVGRYFVLLQLSFT